MQEITDKAVRFEFNEAYLELKGFKHNDEIAYRLSWTDGVANEWNEWFTELSVAMLRLAVIIRCGESDWQKFANETDLDVFTMNASTTLDKEIR